MLIEMDEYEIMIIWNASDEAERKKIAEIIALNISPSEVQESGSFVQQFFVSQRLTGEK